MFADRRISVDDGRYGLFWFRAVVFDTGWDKLLTDAAGDAHVCDIEYCREYYSNHHSATSGPFDASGCECLVLFFKSSFR